MGNIDECLINLQEPQRQLSSSWFVLHPCLGALHGPKFLQDTSALITVSFDNIQVLTRKAGKLLESYLLCARYCRFPLPFIFSPSTYELNDIIIPILQIKRLKPRQIT